MLVLDANGDVTSKGALFKKAWAEEYKGIVEYRNNHVVTGVDETPVTTWADLYQALQARAGKPVTISYRRGSQLLPWAIPVLTDDLFAASNRRLTPTNGHSPRNCVSTNVSWNDFPEPV